MRWLTASAPVFKVAVLCVVGYALYVAGLFSLSDLNTQPEPGTAIAAATVEPLAPGPTAAASATLAVAAVGIAPTATLIPAAAGTATPVPPTPAPTPAVVATGSVVPTPAVAATVSVVPTPITLPRPQPTPTAAPVTAGLAVSAGTGAGLRVELKHGDGTAIGGAAVTIYKQIADVGGNPAFGDRVANDSTAANTGRAAFDLPAGVYALRVDGLAGYPFGKPFDIQVATGNATIVSVTLGKLSVGMVDADGHPLNHSVTVLTQNPDLTGNPVLGERIGTADTGRTGVAGFDLTAGVYAVSIDGLAGYAWGSPFNYSVSAGQTNQVVVKLGRIVVGTTNAQLQPESRRVQIVTLQPDVNGSPAADKLVANEDTSKTTGLGAYDLTAGTYAVAVNGYQPKVVTLEPGKTQTLKLSPATP